MAAMIASEIYDITLASRILSASAIGSGMPVYQYISKRFLTFFQNLLLGTKLSEFITGYRAFARKVLEQFPLSNNSDDFIFDNQRLTQTIAFGLLICKGQTLRRPLRWKPEIL